MAGPTQNNFNRDKKNNDQNNDPMGKEARPKLMPKRNGIFVPIHQNKI